MPDVAQSQRPDFVSAIDWVGMEDVDLPLQLSKTLKTPAKANVFVNIVQPDAKGIHMSRLYLSLAESLENQPLSVPMLKSVLQTFVDSQEGIATAARLEVSWDHLLKRKALLSDNKGWKSYPVELVATFDGTKTDVQLCFSALYSSTCPCSAALSRQLLKEEFEKEFSEERKTLDFDKVATWLAKHKGATPHSQRSSADVALWVNGDFDIEAYINVVEDSLKTPVQTAVKREDEQEFARLNGSNLMFVEDALRLMKQSLSAEPSILDFSIKASHFESLHAHDAVGWISKNGPLQLN